MSTSLIHHVLHVGQTIHVDSFKPTTLTGEAMAVGGLPSTVSGYDTPVNQMEIPQYASQRAVVMVLLPKGATDAISLSALQPTSQNTDPTSFYFLILFNI